MRKPSLYRLTRALQQTDVRYVVIEFESEHIDTRPFQRPEFYREYDIPSQSGEPSMIRPDEDMEEDLEDTMKHLFILTHFGWASYPGSCGQIILDVEACKLRVNLEERMIRYDWYDVSMDLIPGKKLYKNLNKTLTQSG